MATSLLTGPSRPVLDRPVLDRAGRRAAGVAAAAAIATVSVFGARYAGSTGAGRLDRGARRVVARIPAGRGGLAWKLIDAHDPASFGKLVVALAGTCLLLRRGRLAAVALGGPVLTGIATTVLKRAVGRRFRGGKLAYPSGHTGGATALGLGLGLLVADVLRAPAPARVALAAGAAVGTGAGMGIALTATHLHYPTDVLGGFCTAVAVVGGTAYAVDLVAERCAPAVHAASPKTA